MRHARLWEERNAPGVHSETEFPHRAGRSAEADRSARRRQLPSDRSAIRRRRHCARTDHSRRRHADRHCRRAGGGALPANRRERRLPLRLLTAGAGMEALSLSAVRVVVAGATARRWLRRRKRSASGCPEVRPSRRARLRSRGHPNLGQGARRQRGGRRAISGAARRLLRDRGELYAMRRRPVSAHRWAPGRAWTAITISP